MSFKSSNIKTRPDRVKESHPPSAPPPTHPGPPSWSAQASKTRRPSSSSVSTTASFHDARFPADEELRMVSSSNDIKKSANSQFAAADYDSALGTYDRAAAELPNYLDFEMAVLQSNIAACHIKLEQWKEAVSACERALDGLEREMPMPKPKKDGKTKKKSGRGSMGGKNIPTGKKTLDSDTESEAEVGKSEGNTVVELPSDNDDEDDAVALKALDLSDQRKTDILRIRTKTLLRRARAKTSMVPESWTNLGGALEDYTLLATPGYFRTLPVSDQKTVRMGLVELPPRVNAAKEKEVGEMMGKLKDLGNGILKPFGLSTDMFKMVKDENSGGYSMSFQQGGKN